MIPPEWRRLPEGTPVRRLRLLREDQLDRRHNWFREASPETLYLLMELRSETDPVLLHAQKLIALFSAMRAFAGELAARGHRVFYLTLGDGRNRQTLPENLNWIVKACGASLLEFQEPEDYDRRLLFRELADRPAAVALGKGGVRLCSSEHFLAGPEEAALFQGERPPRMENFYRKLRKRRGVLLDERGSPLGGAWNFDARNRKPWRGRVAVPSLPLQERDETALWAEIRGTGVAAFGDPRQERFFWPRNRREALTALEEFWERRFPLFGPYQDALSQEQPFLFHSLLSFALNTKMLSPAELIDQAEERLLALPPGEQEALLPSAEGFIRQILGWREYMKCYYDRFMPGLAKGNFLEARRDLPRWFWTGRTRMACAASAVRSSLSFAYAHHIQRLMVTGNFALLAEIDPEQTDRWYRGIYIDAFDWVERSNTRAMALYADGGLVATKPYCAGGGYIRRMSDHCGHCPYDPRDAAGPRACPFSALYWRFIHRRRELWRKNPRMSLPLRNWEGFPRAKRESILARAEALWEDLEKL